MARERQPWLDYVRFFSIFLVIAFHTPPRIPWLDDAVILNLRVPVFFCISGFLYSIDRWPTFARYARHRARQILVPYTTFFVIFYALWLLVGRRADAADAALPLWQPVVEFLTGNPVTVVHPFWYIACLFTMQMLYYGVERLVPRRWVFGVCCLLAVSTYFITMFWQVAAVRAIYNFWNLGNALLFLPFYALGNSFKPRIAALRFSSPCVTVGLMLLALGSMAAMVALAPVKVADPGLYALLRDVAGLLVIPAYFGAAKWLASRFGRRRVIEFVTVSGTVYLGLQNYFIGVCKILLSHLFYPDVIIDHVWLKLVIALVVMVAIYPVAVFIDRKCPWLIGKGPLFDRW